MANERRTDDLDALAEDAPSLSEMAIGSACRAIRDHYRRMGCFHWDREKFIRLCVAWDETPREMGARVGMTPRRVKQILDTPKLELSDTEGILLQQHLRFIEYIRTGHERDDQLFPPPKL